MAWFVVSGVSDISVLDFTAPTVETSAPTTSGVDDWDMNVILFYFICYINLSDLYSFITLTLGYEYHMTNIT